MINRNQVNADYTEERSWIFLKSSDIWKFSKHLYNTWLDKTLCLKKCCLKNGVFGKCISVCERGRIHIKQVLKICKAIYHQIHCHLYHLSPFSTLESKENGHKVARRNEKAKIRQVTKSHFKSPLHGFESQICHSQIWILSIFLLQYFLIKSFLTNL